MAHKTDGYTGKIRMTPARKHALIAPGLDSAPLNTIERNDPTIVAESRAMKAAKSPFALVPYEAVDLMANAFALGRVKYEQWDYLRSPLRTSVYIGAALRHLFKVMRYGPGAIDPDPRNVGIGATHLGCALASLAMLAATYRNSGTLDDTRQETESA